MGFFQGRVAAKDFRGSREDQVDQGDREDRDFQADFRGHRGRNGRTRRRTGRCSSANGSSTAIRTANDGYRLCRRSRRD